VKHQPPRQRADSLRRIPLPEVLRAAGAQPDSRDKSKWHTARGTISISAQKFFNWNEDCGGGGAIDLAMHINTIGFRDSLDWLEQLRPSTSVPSASAKSPRRMKLPSPSPRHIGTVTSYLSTTRRLPADAIDPLVHCGRLYADYRANAVFILSTPGTHRPVGAELRGTGTHSWRGMAPGTNKNLGYFAISPSNPCATLICESAIDAISAFVLYPSFYCISASGARPTPQWLSYLIARDLPIYCGFDADPTGDIAAANMQQKYSSIQRLRPPQHDWNDTLRSAT